MTGECYQCGYGYESCATGTTGIRCSSGFALSQPSGQCASPRTVFSLHTCPHSSLYVYPFSFFSFFLCKDAFIYKVYRKHIDFACAGFSGSCTTGSFPGDGACAACPAECSSCLSSQACLECQAGLTMSAGVCASMFALWKYLRSSLSECFVSAQSVPILTHPRIRRRC